MEIRRHRTPILGDREPSPPRRREPSAHLALTLYCEPLCWRPSREPSPPPHRPSPPPGRRPPPLKTPPRDPAHSPPRDIPLMDLEDERTLLYKKLSKIEKKIVIF